MGSVLDHVAKLDAHLRSEEKPLTTTWPRYFGFCNDVGEALKGTPFMPKPLYYGTYAATAAYMGAAIWFERKRLEDTKLPAAQVDELTKDISIWHFFATFSLTPLCIAGLKKGLGKFTHNKYVKAAIAVPAILVIVPPMDNFVTYVMNNSYRDKTNQQEYHWTGLYASLAADAKHKEL